MGEITDLRFDFLDFRDEARKRIAALEARVTELEKKLHELTRATAKAVSNSIVYK